MENKTVAIHQPNFFPWLGYFDKINKSDVFIILDHVVNNPRSALWTKRVKILVNGAENWLTLSLRSDPLQLFIPISGMEIDKPELIGQKHLKTIELNYKKSPYFKEVFPEVEHFYRQKTALISDRNREFIQTVSRKLGITTEFRLSSEMDCGGQATDLLISLCKQVNAGIYMPGGGATGYQEDEKFGQAGIELKPQHFNHPVYSQARSSVFIPGLSILDPLMNIGFEGVKKLLNIAQ